MEEGSTPPNRPPYRLSPKEHEELTSPDRRSVGPGAHQAQLQPLWCTSLIRPEERWALADVRGLPSS